MDNTCIEGYKNRVKTRDFTVGIMGLGYVGLPLAFSFSNQGFRVLGLDLDTAKITQLMDGKSYFKHIPATELKIDRSFVSRMLTEPLDLELVKAIIHLAHQFGLTVVAEGVEDEKTLALLRELGCDYAQGYYFSPPLPESDFVDWLAAYRDNR